MNELNVKLDCNQYLYIETLGMLFVHCARLRKPWQDFEVPRLVADRKGCSDRVRRLELSKLISRAVRCAKRRYCTAEATRILQEFRDLNRLNNAHNSTDFPSRDQQCLPDYFTELLESVYASSADCPFPCKDSIRQFPRFSLIELNKALIQMSSYRCAHCFGI